MIANVRRRAISSESVVMGPGSVEGSAAIYELSRRECQARRSR
jgi:hypothetical protein